VLATSSTAIGCSSAGGTNAFGSPGGSAGSAASGGSAAGGFGGGGGFSGGSGGFGATGGGSGVNCSDAARYVYVIDQNNTLLKFDPSIATPAAFTRVGPMGCRAGQGPNSMAIDRAGRAWVLYGTDNPLSPNQYDCAGVWFVDINNAACLGQSPFQCGSAGFYKFGMGYATDQAGGTTETLYIASLLRPALGRVDGNSGQVTSLGALSAGAEFTGNAKGELWGFFPGNPSRVLQIDKSNAQTLTTFNLPQLPPLGGAYAFAFAFWGGAFYIFYQVDGVDVTTNVWKLTTDGNVVKYIPNTGLRIVGAGVSTCAPIEPPT
jgi:hypothetical protein